MAEGLRIEEMRGNIEDYSHGNIGDRTPTWNWRLHGYKHLTNIQLKKCRLGAWQEWFRSIKRNKELPNISKSNWNTGKIQQKSTVQVTCYALFGTATSSTHCSLTVCHLFHQLWYARAHCNKEPLTWSTFHNAAAQKSWTSPVPSVLFDRQWCSSCTDFKCRQWQL